VPPTPATPGDATPRGLRAQIAATKDALLALARAHIDLAKAEADEIKGEVTRASALAGLAIGAGIVLALFLPIGGFLFLGEWIFGSIGWGLLLGSELLIALAVTAVLVALRVPGLGRDAIVALVIAIVVGIVAGVSLFNRLFTQIGESANLAVDPAYRPLLVGVVLVGVIVAIVGLVVGARLGRTAGAAIGGLFGGLVAGIVFGAFLSIDYGPRIGAALAVAAFFAAWVVLMLLRLKRQGIDAEQLKRRFWPQETIDTTKESIEWAKERLPRGPRS
jgi:preprotein translocase subunit SecG